MKTHTPIDGINYYPASTYIAVYRDPRDVYFSLRNHIQNMNMDVQSEWLEEDASESFRKWSVAPHVAGASELFTLSEMVYHYKSFLNFKHLPNIHFFHFSDFKRDLAGQMQRMAEILKIEVEQKSKIALSKEVKRDSSLRRITHPGRERITTDGCNLNAIQLAPEVRRGAVWMRCTQERTSANPLECGLAKA